MSPTWLEIVVAILLLWIAWRIALLLTPLVLKRFRERRAASTQRQNLPPKELTVLSHDRGDKHEP